MNHSPPLELLNQASTGYATGEIADRVAERGLVKVGKNDAAIKPMPRQTSLLAFSPLRAVRSAQRKKFTFIDLFAGIGGIRMGFEAHGGECVFTSEWNDFSKKTYLVPDRKAHSPYGKAALS